MTSSESMSKPTVKELLNALGYIYDAAFQTANSEFEQEQYTKRYDAIHAALEAGTDDKLVELRKKVEALVPPEVIGQGTFDVGFHAAKMKVISEIDSASEERDSTKEVKP